MFDTRSRVSRASGDHVSTSAQAVDVARSGDTAGPRRRRRRAAGPPGPQQGAASGAARGSPRRRRPRPPAPRPRPRSGPSTRSAAPCTSVRASSGAWSATIVEAATVANDQPRPSRKSPAKICHELPSGAEAAQHQRDQQDHSPGAEHRRPADAVGEHADQRREREHAQHVDADHDPDHPQLGATVLHVQRRHHHHRDHDRVRAGQAGDRGREHRSLPDASTARPHEVAGGRRRLLRQRRGRVSSGSGRRNSPTPARRRACRRCRARTVRSARGCRAGRRPPPRGRSGWGRRRHRRRGPDHGRERARPVASGREVGGGVPGAAVGRGRRAEQHGPDAAAAASSRATPATTASTAPAAAEQVAGDQADPATATRHQAGEQVRRHGRAEHLAGLRQARLRPPSRRCPGPAARRWRCRS